MPLPFLKTGALVEQGGALVAGAAAVPVSVWPAESTVNSERGRHHTHRGEAALQHAAALRVPNRSLVIDADRYKIVSATPNVLLPHCVLELALTSGRS